MKRLAKSIKEKRVTIIIAVAVSLLYALLLGCLGVFGEAAAVALIAAVLFGGKWLLILGGYAFALWLPFRIMQAKRLDAARKEHYKEVEKTIKQMQQKSEQQKIEEAILKAYQKAEDNI